MLQGLISFLSKGFALGEQIFCSLREVELQGVVTNFAHDEVSVGLCRHVRINSKRIFTVCCLFRIESQKVPVTGSYGLLHLQHGLVHTGLDAVVDTRCICDDEGRSFVSFSFFKSSYGLLGVSTHSDLSYINIAVSHSDLSEVFLLDFLTCCCELGNCSDRCSLGGLSAGVGVNFGIEYHDVYVFAGSEYVVNAAVTDIICPAVSAEDPH